MENYRKIEFENAEHGIGYWFETSTCRTNLDEREICRAKNNKKRIELEYEASLRAGFYSRGTFTLSNTSGLGRSASVATLWDAIFNLEKGRANKKVARKNNPKPKKRSRSRHHHLAKVVTNFGTGVFTGAPSKRPDA